MDVTGYVKLTSHNKKMQASAKYRIPQRRNYISRPEGYQPLRRLIPHCREDVFVCSRCGETCTAIHCCKALDRQCFSCRSYGHYSKFCGEKMSRKVIGLSLTTQPKAKTKSTRNSSVIGTAMFYIRRKKLCAQ